MAILLIKRADNPVPESPGKWRAGEVVAVVESDHVFGAKETVQAGHFLHLEVSDKTKAEVDSYTQSWRHNPTTQQISATGDDRRIEVTSDMVAVGGANAFTQVEVEALMTDIGGTYVSHTNSSFQFDITATLEERDEIIQQINEAVRNMQHKRTRWYVPQASRTFIEGQGGFYSNTAANINSGGHLRDGLLD